MKIRPKDFLVPAIFVLLVNAVIFGVFSLATVGAIDANLSLFLAIIAFGVFAPFYFGIQKHSRDWLYQAVVLLTQVVCFFAMSYFSTAIVQDMSALVYIFAAIFLSVFFGGLLLIDVIRLVVDRIEHRKPKKAKKEENYE